jgi:predicted TIM-barrel fold metal-dependent hydrolase
MSNNEVFEMHNFVFALMKLPINVQLFIDRWNVSKSMKLSLKWNFQYKLIVLIINKQCWWMKFMAHVVGCMHETRWLMKYMYGSNWPHKCYCSTCESYSMDQLWWHQPN